MLNKLGIYGIVGVLSALLHAIFLVALPRIGVPLALANLIGFLVASFWSYLAHSKVSFRQQTKGQLFPRRWLLLQTGLNVILSLLLPTVLARWAQNPLITLTLVFTPTAVNFMVWNFAARHVVRIQSGLNAIGPDCHADDLGLDEAINDAIFDLADRGQLQSASLMVAGPAVAHALDGLSRRPKLKIYLHLVLSEGPPICPPEQIPLLVNPQGLMNLSFGQLLMASIWCKTSSGSFVSQLATEIKAQILMFQELTGQQFVSLDGHQHLHLLPLVWGELLKLEPPLRPVWLRTIREPWPPTIPIATWTQSMLSAGVIKWLVLSLLSFGLQPELRKKGIATNSRFAGVLFTGRMAGTTLKAAYRHLSYQPTIPRNEGLTAPLLLIHPARQSESNTTARHSKGPNSRGSIDSRYKLSLDFYASAWRQREYLSMAHLAEDRDARESSIDRIK